MLMPCRTAAVRSETERCAALHVCYATPAHHHNNYYHRHYYCNRHRCHYHRYPAIAAAAAATPTTTSAVAVATLALASPSCVFAPRNAFMEALQGLGVSVVI